MMNSLIGSWKTSFAGITAGLLLLGAQTYHSGMTFEQWGVAIAQAVAVALTGILAQDHKNPAP